MPRARSPLVAFGKRVRTRRQALNLTQEELAGSVRITPPYLSDIERGRRDVGFTTLLRLGEALEVSLDELAYGQKQQDAPSDRIVARIEAARAWPKAKQEAALRILDELARL